MGDLRDWLSLSVKGFGNLCRLKVVAVDFVVVEGKEEILIFRVFKN